MKQHEIYGRIGLLLAVATLCWASGPQPAGALTEIQLREQVRATGVPDYHTSPNWAYSPTSIRKFVDTLPGVCLDANNDGDLLDTGDIDGTNNLSQCIPVASPTILADGSHYYEIEVLQYREQMHTDLPALAANGGTGAKDDPLTTGGTLLRGYRQTNVVGTHPANTPHQMGPVIIAQRDVPVRIKFTNSLPTNGDGNLFIPVDTTVMGSGPGPLQTRVDEIRNDAELCAEFPANCFTQNRHVIHLHGGRTPWISDGTAHQWITPEGEFNPLQDQYVDYSKGSSVAYVPDMWFDGIGNFIPACTGQTSCPNASNNPGEASQTYYYTNGQSARMMFYHDHSWGITRLNVYAGGVAGYFVEDQYEQSLVTGGLIPGWTDTIPLIIQDKAFVDATTILDDASTPTIPFDGTDPTWVWGSSPGSVTIAGFSAGSTNGWNPAGADPVTGDLWWPHVYVPAQDPWNPDLSGVNPYGRWAYGPWFWPPTNVPFGPIPNPYYDNGTTTDQAPEIVGSPNPSWGAEAFLDAPVINGTAYPRLEVDPKTYRFRILNGAHDRFWNLQLYVADPGYSPAVATPPLRPLSEVAMVQAVATNCFPGNPCVSPPTGYSDESDDFMWPADDREGGVPDPQYRGPAMVQFGTDGGILPTPVILPNRPVNWNVDVTTFAAGTVLQQNEGGGTLMLGPAERADVLIDFSQFAGKTLILYNDAPAPWPAGDFHYDYYTGNPDYRPDGGADTTLAGYGPNTRTLMQIVVSGTDSGSIAKNAIPANVADIKNALKSKTLGGGGLFEDGQEPMIIAQGFPVDDGSGVPSYAYNDAYGVTFPATYPYWGISRIWDTSISFSTPDGALVNAYPMEPKAIQDEQGEVFDEFGRMSAKLGLELAFTTAGIQTFITQNFVDIPTEIIAQDQVQIWKITHNGVDTHPVHFHLFEVQLINRVGWDGFIYTPDANEIGWKDTIRISPLMDTIVALRPVKVPVPFDIPNSLRPLNPAYPLGEEAEFTNIDPITGQPRTEPLLNQIYNFGHEYLWHCHILSHEEQDMMRVIVLNANSLLYTENGVDGLWQWNRGDWTQIYDSQPENYVASGTFAYADLGVDGLWQWNGYDWRQIEEKDPGEMVASESGLYVTFTDGLYHWNRNSWTRINTVLPDAGTMVTSEAGLYASFTGYGMYNWNKGKWTRINTVLPDPGSVTATGNLMYASFTGYGLYQWNGSSWSRLNTVLPDVGSVVTSQSVLYARFTGYGLYKWEAGIWKKINNILPDAGNMASSGGILYAGFTGWGLYEWNGNLWNRISVDSTVPSDIEVSGSILYANFGGINGVRKWEHGTWDSLMNNTAVIELTAGF